MRNWISQHRYQNLCKFDQLPIRNIRQHYHTGMLVMFAAVPNLLNLADKLHSMPDRLPIL